MIEVLQAEAFTKWVKRLRDRQAVARIQARIRMLSIGHAGDSKAVGGGVSELRIDHGPGYRVYYFKRGVQVFVLLCGGDKRTQQADIARAHKLKESFHG